MIRKKVLIRLIGLLLIAFVALWIFTPLGFYVQLYANRILSHNPTPVAERQQQVLEDYDWNLHTMEGAAINLESHKGELLFINFWATWCPPCVAEMPGLQDLYTDYGDKVTFMFVARDKKERVTQFLENKGYDIPVYFENGLVPRKIYYGGLPTTFVISKDGRIVVSEVGSADWNSEQTRALLDSLLVQ